MLVMFLLTMGKTPCYCFWFQHANDVSGVWSLEGLNGGSEKYIPLYMSSANW
jgi:hypothetical protein